MTQYKYKKEIAKEYGFTVKTLNRKLKRSNIIVGRGLLSIAQQKQIYNQLGYPSGVDVVEYTKGGEQGQK